jgi:choline-phosphate cytidylyltransferase
MTHAERCESVRHCRWVDQVVEDAPWVIDDAFLEKYQIDYVAHDEDPYKGIDMDDVYDLLKSRGMYNKIYPIGPDAGCNFDVVPGKFIPTRRTPGVSTSELLERMVVGYRHGDWDPKLEKMGHPELKSRQGSPLLR